MKLSRLARTRLGYALGLLAVAVGVGYVFGLGAALIVGGVACAMSFLLLAPVDEKPKEPTP